MTLIAMTIPDDPAALSGWLEQRLLAPDFGRFIGELSVLFPAAGRSPAPAFDRWLPVALNQGLGKLPTDLLRQLLRHPAALAELQERVVTDGGPYWDVVADRSDDLTESFDAGRRALDQLLAPPPAPKATKAVTVPSEVAKRTTGRSYKAWAFTSTAVAACLAVTVGVMVVRSLLQEEKVRKADVAWGWGKPNGLALDQDRPRDYLNQLAKNVEEWNDYKPDGPTAVALRLAEFRVGCSKLMHSSYGPLKPADKDWLLAKCREWGERLDAHQQDLDRRGDRESALVRAEVDKTVELIANTLRQKAKEV
jgi:hypothetical protein